MTETKVLIPGLTLVRKPLETYLIVREEDGDRELTAAECEKLYALASPSTQEPALRGERDLQEEMMDCYQFGKVDVQKPIFLQGAADILRIELRLRQVLSFKDAEWVLAALRTHAGESAAQSEPVPDASMTNADWLRAISAWVPQYADHLGEAADELNELRSEREQLTEQLAIRSESGMAKDMQEIMRINNELKAALAAERQRRDAESWRTKAAEWHAERANGLRNIAATTRRDWTDPKHYSEEDRRANYADARENDQRAGWHEQCRDALQAAITRAHSDDRSEEGKGG